MTQSHEPALPSIDVLAYDAIVAGRVFADRWQDAPIDVPFGTIRREILDTLERLQEGVPYGYRERGALHTIGGLIGTAADAVQPGYGQRALHMDPRVEEFPDPDLECVCLLGWCWKCLMSCLDRRDDRVTADHQARQLIRIAVSR